MNIKYKHLKEASEAYETIKQINKEIKEIESLIKLAANGNNVVAKMKITDQELLEKEKNSVGFDEDGSLFRGSNSQLPPDVINPFFRHFSNMKKQNRSKAKFKVEISNGTAIRVLRILIEEKVKERNTFLAELQQLGFNII